MKRLNIFWLALILAVVVESILAMAALTFATPYFDPGGSQHDTDTAFIKYSRMIVCIVHLPAIFLAQHLFGGWLQLLAIGVFGAIRGYKA
jgi:hypothetical protein